MKFTHLILVMATLALLALGCSTEDCLASDTSVGEYVRDTSVTFSQPPIEYIDDNGNPTGLYYIINEPGDTVTPTAASTITFTYEGQTINPEPDVFDQSGDTPLTYPLSNLITAWQLALPLIGQGGQIQLFVPANLAYGANQAGKICPNSDLIFDITLVGVEN